MISLRKSKELGIKTAKIMKHSKSWWDDKYSCDLKTYRITKSLNDWKAFKEWLSPQKEYSLSSKYRKLQIKSKVPGNL